MEYSKPHLSYQAQLELLKSRNLEVVSEHRAMSLLQSVGYYRLSAFVYPFRENLPPEEQTPEHTKSEVIREGVTFDHVRNIWSFDRHLRLLIIEASEIIEVGLRTQIAHVLGKRDPYGHLSQEHLDQRTCQKLVGRKRKNTPKNRKTEFQLWEKRHNELLGRAQKEDFVKHHHAKYGTSSPIPVWIATEYWDFGAAVRLYGLLKPEDQNEIASNFGFSSGKRFHSVLTVLNYMRNTAAHHSRIWNRVPTYKLPDSFHKGELVWLEIDWDKLNKSSIYPSLLMMGYLVVNINPYTGWHHRAKELFLDFPEVPYLSIYRNMGFPPDWADTSVWIENSFIVDVERD